MSAGEAARRLASQVAAPGTDPSALLTVVAFLLAPRRTAAVLRRRCGDGSRSPAAAAGRPAADTVAASVPVLRAWADLGVRVALVGDPAYPARLAAGWPDLDAPPFLAWRGPVDGIDAGGLAVALVGSRRASGYGTGVAAWLAAALAAAGVRIVSGGAIGVDAAAHGAALGEPGGTTVVLGCGHGVAYPRPHATRGGLFDRVLAAGGSLVGELLPATAPRAGAVRARNRIVARLADAVVVVEGGERSGALVTAGAAAELGIPVLAVPGDVRAPGSVAPHRLLAEGAAPCTGPGDVLAALGAEAHPTPDADRAGSPAVRPPPGSAALGSLPGPLAEALARRWPRPVRVDDLAAETGLAAPALLAALTRARVEGVVAESADGVRLRRAPA